MFDLYLGPSWLMLLVIFIVIFFGYGFAFGFLLGLVFTRRVKDKKKKLWQLFYWGVSGGLIMVVSMILKEKFIR